MYEKEMKAAEAKMQAEMLKQAKIDAAQRMAQQQAEDEVSAHMKMRRALADIRKVGDYKRYMSKYTQGGRRRARRARKSRRSRR